MANPYDAQSGPVSGVRPTSSTRIGGLLGPVLMAITATEWINRDIFAAAMGPSYAPHVYLDGTLLLVAGLAIVRAHNYWIRGWPVLITLVGWLFLLSGLLRMAAPLSAQAAGGSPAVLYGSQLVLFAVGAIVTFKSYVRNERPTR